MPTTESATAEGLEVRLLGEVEVLRGGTALELPASRKTRALLAYLVATRRPHLREGLCTLLWEGPDDPRGSLRWSLSKIRPLLDEPDRPRLSADRERVGFDAVDCRLDLLEIERLGSAPLDQASEGDLARAAGRFRGSFLEGLDLTDSPGFHAWCTGKRAELGALRLAVLEALVQRLDAQPEEALRYARMRLGVEPLLETSHAHVVRLLGKLGRVREAREAYEIGKDLMARELGASASGALERARMGLPRAGPDTSAEPPAPAPASEAPAPERAAVADAPAAQTPPAGPAVPAATVAARAAPSKRRRLFAAAGVAALAAVAAWFILARPGPPPSSLEVRSLAVLPLADLSGDSAQEHFADALTDTLITHLAGIRALRVVSRQSVIRYRRSTMPLPEIARELAVDAVVVGSIIRSGGKVRIAAQLLHGPSDRHLWAGSYERDLADVLGLQMEVTREIVREIRVALTPGEQAQLGRSRRVDPEAYDLYARGRFFWHARAGGDFERNVREAIAHFERAIAKDPGFAQAFAALAESYVPLGFLGLEPPAQAARRIRDAVESALRLDGELAEAHTALAASRGFFEWDWAGSEQLFQRAIALNPNYAPAHLWYAALLGGLGRQEENLRERRRAIELDPSTLVLGGPAYALSLLGRYDEAISEYRKALELGPGFANTRNNLGRLYLHLGRHDEAIAAFERTGSTADLAQAYARAGRRAEAQRLLDQLTSAGPGRYVSPLDLALIHAALGHAEAALQQLERAYEERTPLLLELKVSFGLRQLRDDPRFQALAARMKLP